MRVTRLVDLSVPVDTGTQVYPGDPVFSSHPHATVAADGFHVQAISMGSQTGTHVDAPFHFADDGPRIDQLDLALFTGPAVLLDVRGRAPRTRLTWADLGEPDLAPGTLVLLHTGWSAHYGTPAYFDHPYLDAGAARRLLEAGVRTIGLDAPNLDLTPTDDDPGEGYPVHHLLAAAGGVICENLTNLAAVDFADPFVSLLPLRLTGADGAPVRAVAMELAP
ncbi:cyclase family protein [Klenkia taihuensis]|uniref:Kynurenine formamidase n=1 Tax=Klenkia taihuensis TaxID=1225127 RepID=A0A1I1HZ19_9ACTN|nr:cyclase family protein [Klenkia taihuensis]GHE08935.1 cyclase [Klenkia taihuensis]SFC29081.1 Kynurenine formamidase [Klenkia taihuensis]